MITISWTADHEFDGFEGSSTDIPDWAYGITVHPDDTVTYVAAAVIMNGLEKLREPIWLHPGAASDLAVVGILDEDPGDNAGIPVPFDGVEVLLYVGPL